MSGVIASSKAAADHPATVTIKTVIERRFPPFDHMLAEHDLQQATRFRGACGHIPSSQLFEIDALHGATRSCRQTLTFLVRTFFSVTAPSRGGAGGAGRDRTDDLMLAKQPLSQLSYSPNLMIGMRVCRKQPEGPSILVGLGRLERPTSPLSGVRSNHLSYRPERRSRLSG